MIVFYMKKENFGNFLFILSYRINEVIEFLSFLQKKSITKKLESINLKFFY